MGDMGDPPKKKRLISLCVGCGNQIHDQYILRVSPDLEWHAACLKCAECNQYLDETCTCFVRDGKTYCKRDYISKDFSEKHPVGDERVCSSTPEWEHFLTFIYWWLNGRLLLHGRRESCHPLQKVIICFVGCQREIALPFLPECLSPGSRWERQEEERRGRDAERVHHPPPPPTFPCPTSLESSSLQTPCFLLMGILFLPSPSLTAEPISARQPALRPHVHKQPEKTTRVRTVLNEKQLHTLRTCYAANPRPDALMKEQLVEMTGLSPRVIRVWFQNKRCKDKKRSIMMKQLQQQQPNDKTNIQGMTGTPMVAASPERHDGGLQANPVEVQSYQPPWKVLSDFALQSDIDQPAFQQLVNFSEGGPGSNSTGSEVASMSSQLPDTPNSMVASPIEA
ncbi:insulin gene enhancer protein ISL-1 [Cyanistes caeruleus]|uniref:insulin gene enhancer protein ISL-1 n=1 Tax=Cyanistes caeruleus TaxID=156563 RepID=UPI000CDB9D79|nr:insulin gene enhancer protein ISL-1 [Cyanistes caeruleus]